MSIGEGDSYLSGFSRHNDLSYSDLLGKDMVSEVKISYLDILPVRDYNMALPRGIGFCATNIVEG